ncbi:hypothetical protein [Streptomyces hoynatensis]|uniref:AbiEi antitoxin C-terminal domain-containing protein n=1 Tax=Streptomyces hoynatensis TaxID=1141874 RepID=A0A3A9YQW1_9ACTN|nr:hypothetical protein [Streptomyces hoynatensis]RKN37636.1 hypothetical protein D7294_27255 [Streptomyces hoynatensis]
MNDDTRRIPRPLHQLAHKPLLVMTAQELREHGVPAAAAHERCRPGGPWQMPLPGVFLLRPGPPTAEELLRAVLRYAGGRDGETVVTGPAALALHGFSGVPPLTALDRVDVLVPSTRRLRSAGCARIVRTHLLPRPVRLAGVPVAPVPRALADAVAGAPEGPAAGPLLHEAVRGGHCAAAELIAELAGARLLDHPRIAGAVDTLLAEGRAVAEERLLDAVRLGRLPDPCWNVDLWLPGGPRLGSVDAYWPGPAVGVRIDAGPPRPQEPAALRRLAGLGVEVVRLTARALCADAAGQAEALRAALRRASGRGGPEGRRARTAASRLVVLPR